LSFATMVQRVISGSARDPEIEYLETSLP